MGGSFKAEGFGDGHRQAMLDAATQPHFSRKEMITMVTYDSKIIYKYAQRLYNQANMIIFICFLFGGGIPGLLCYFATNREAGGIILSVVLGVLGSLIGLLIGIEMSFVLKLKAQVALCQVKIEENTRSIVTTPAMVA